MTPYDRPQAKILADLLHANSPLVNAESKCPLPQDIRGTPVIGGSMTLLCHAKDFCGFLLPVPGMITGIQRHFKNGLYDSKTINMTAKILAKANQEMDELRTKLLQTKATVNYSRLKHNLGCLSFPGLCCFNVSEFLHIMDVQIANQHKEKNKISQVNRHHGLDSFPLSLVL